MAISFNTGTTANSGSSQVASQQITIPAGVLAGDIILVCAYAVTLTLTPAVLGAASTGTAPVSAGVQATGSEPLPASVTGAVFYIAAGASDAGKIITISSNASAFISVALAAYTGATPFTPVDVISSAFGGASSNSVTCPVLSTRIGGDWGVSTGGGASEGFGFAGPATSREAVTSSAAVSAGISDTNTPTGPPGSPIGGGKFTCTTAANSILVAFTIGLSPPSPSPFAQPHQAQQGNRIAGKGLFTSGNGALVFIPVVSPFILPRKIAARHPAAVRGGVSGSPGAPVTAIIPVPSLSLRTGVIISQWQAETPAVRWRAGPPATAWHTATPSAG